MMSLEVGNAIRSLVPDGEWVIEDDDLDSIKWISPKKAPVTTAKILAEVTRIEAEKADIAAAKQAALESAKAKLAKLGLTAEEAAAIVGA